MRSIPINSIIKVREGLRMSERNKVKSKRNPEKNRQGN